MPILRGWHFFMYLCVMRRFIERIFGKRRPASPKRALETDLLLDEKELSEVARLAQSWIVNISSSITPEDTQILYRNLIKLTAVRHVPYDAFEFRLHGALSRLQHIEAQLRRSGFTNIHVDADVEEDGNLQSTAKKRLKPFRTFTVAGLAYHLNEDDPVWTSLKEGMSLNLIPQPDNEYDANAVALTLPKQEAGAFEGIIGYIPRTHNEEIAAILNAGWTDTLRAEITSLKPDAAYRERLEVTVYIISKS